MKRNLIIVAVIVCVLFALQASGTAISLRRGGGGGNGSLKQVEKQHPWINTLKVRMNRAFDTHVDLVNDLTDPSDDWNGDDYIDIAGKGSRTLVVNPSIDKTIRVLRLRNDEDDVTVNVIWTPRADPNAAWWDVTAKKSPTQRLQLRPEAEQTLVILKGGGTLTFETKGDDDAWVEFKVDE